MPRTIKDWMKTAEEACKALPPIKGDVQTSYSNDVHLKFGIPELLRRIDILNLGEQVAAGNSLEAISTFLKGRQTHISLLAQEGISVLHRADETACMVLANLLANELGGSGEDYYKVSEGTKKLMRAAAIAQIDPVPTAPEVTVVWDPEINHACRDDLLDDISEYPANHWHALVSRYPRDKLIKLILDINCTQQQLKAAGDSGLSNEIKTHVAQLLEDQYNHFKKIHLQGPYDKCQNKIRVFLIALVVIYWQTRAQSEEFTSTPGKYIGGLFGSFSKKIGVFSKEDINGACDALIKYLAFSPTINNLKSYLNADPDLKKYAESGILLGGTFSGGALLGSRLGSAAMFVSGVTFRTLDVLSRLCDKLGADLEVYRKDMQSARPEQGDEEPPTIVVRMASRG